MKILTLLVGVAVGVAIASENLDQSEPAISEEMPMTSENEGKRQIDTPEVVLQLKYDEGELKRIYLAQFRKPGVPWSPSVADRSNLCADLCHAGLGGPACGTSCSQLMPMGLHSAITNSSDDGAKSDADSSKHADGIGEAVYGQPRIAVCPTLCENFMGAPLCQCHNQDDKKLKVDWVAICDAFCVDGYNLGGCPSCETNATPPSTSLMLSSQRMLGTSEGWALWCDVQCRQGHGGAACNCDRTPF